MGKVKGKHRLDKYYRLAKEHGYRSRASWKLVQLDTKFSFLRSSHAVLDLCAAPGGWMQVAVQRVPVGSLVLGLDLVPIAPIRGAVSLEQDITKSECKARVKKVMEEHGVRAFDLVLHDGSPNVGGAWSQEAMSQNALVIDSVRLATQFLAPKGTFVTKVFRSQDYSSVLYCLKQLFEKVEVDKPAASRSASAEIFVVGLKYKAPAKIDPRLLDVKYLFQGSVEPQRKVVDVLRGTKQKRHRDGYEDGDTTLRKVSSASDFIWSNNPLEILGSVTAITFDHPACLAIKDHELTTEEVKALCDDLRVLGKQDFKHLLKWRMHIRKALSPSQKATAPPTPTPTPTEGEKNEEDEDDRVLNEMEELTYAMDRQKKREKKLLAKKRAKDKARKATGMQVDVMQDGYIDHELFSLASIKGKKDLAAVDSTEYDDAENAAAGVSEDEGSDREAQEHLSSDIDSDEERRKYDEQLEEILDQAYDNYVAKKGGSTKQRKRAKQAYAQEDQLSEGGDDDDTMHTSYDSDKDQGDQDANPLMVPLDDGIGPTQAEITNKWFSQEIFAEAVQDGDLEKFDSEDEMQVVKQVEKRSIPEKAKENVGNDATGPKSTNIQASKAEDDFEIVPAPATDSSEDSSSDESEDEDVDTKAEILACAKKMLRKKQREQMLDDAYNRYMFDDEGLPDWFLDEERRHRQAIKPVTKEEMAAMKAQFKEIDARPAKKVAEAKARKKRVAMRKLEKVRKKANIISDQADINDRSKRKQIEQLYKSAIPKRPKKEYVVAKKGDKDLSASGNENLSNESSKTDEAIRDSNAYQRKNEFSGHIYADGKRWGYYPGLHPRLSFSNFMDAFFRKGKCDMRVFMVWNSPPWMYSVRHQRGLESVLFHHRDACVVVFSETVELDFFKDSFVKDGYKVAVVMPNLDELLKDTPTRIFASVWFEWRKTKFYNIHYSELIRLAALYKYGGIYIDSDIIVLKSLSSLNNSVGMEDKLSGSSLNGAVMAFRKHSPFILECLKEFYSTYDDTRLRWNGADLLQRVARRIWSKENSYSKQFELNVQPSFIFFPISPQNITRFFITPLTESEKAQQDALLKEILDGSLTFHFWNSMTSALIPEPESLVTRLIDYSCIHCSDVL